jgi:hypothetical protein
VADFVGNAVICDDVLKRVELGDLAEGRIFELARICEEHDVLAAIRARFIAAISSVVSEGFNPASE